jgi:tartrate dehydrogenase/decarboxylase / D-malate dehydrogenase
MKAPDLHLGQPAAAAGIVGAIERVLRSGRSLTRDMGGTASTEGLGRTIEGEI